VEENYFAFNLVRYRGQIHAIAQSVGPIDLRTLTEQEWASRRERGEIYSASDATGAKAAVDEGRKARRRQRAAPTPAASSLPTGERNHLMPGNPAQSSPFVVNLDA